VRVFNRGMFATDSASFTPVGAPVERIGAALKGEEGLLLVLAHTDNKRLRTCNSLQLPAFCRRAQAVRAIIARSVGTHAGERARARGYGSIPQYAARDGTEPADEIVLRRQD